MSPVKHRSPQKRREGVILMECSIRTERRALRTKANCFLLAMTQKRGTEEYLIDNVIGSFSSFRQGDGNARPSRSLCRKASYRPSWTLLLMPRHLPQGISVNGSPLSYFLTRLQCSISPTVAGCSTRDRNWSGELDRLPRSLRMCIVQEKFGNASAAKSSKSEQGRKTGPRTVLAIVINFAQYISSPSSQPQRLSPRSYLSTGILWETRV